MNWFSRRPREVIVTHRLDRKSIATLRYLAETLRGHHDPVPPEPKEQAQPSTYEKTVAGMLAALPMPDNRRRHLMGAVQIVLGKRAVPEGFTLADLRRDLTEAGLPLPG